MKVLMRGAAALLAVGRSLHQRLGIDRPGHRKTVGARATDESGALGLS